MSVSEVKRLHLTVPEAGVATLRARLRDTRIPGMLSESWEHGTSSSYLAELLDYWENRFDWSAFERRLNAHANYVTTIDGYDVHFVHARGAGERRVPLLLTHGWPSTYLEMERIIPLLTQQREGLSFDVVAPSVPGFGFSSIPERTGFVPSHTLFVKLMKRLGYDRFFAHAGDIGSGITSRIARYHPEALFGISLQQIVDPVVRGDERLTGAERAYLSGLDDWRTREGGYMHLQRTKPQTVAAALSDSPAGLAAWIVEKYRAWSDCGGDVERRFSKDDILAHVSIYWLTNTISSSMRYYFETRRLMEEVPWDAWIGVPTAVVLFPADLYNTPKEWIERAYNLAMFERMPRGGHFAAFEEPELLAGFLRAFAARN